MAVFADVFNDVTKQGTKLPTSDYLDDGLYPIIDQGQDEIAGYTNQTEGLFTDVPAIVFGDHTRVIKYVDKPCFLGADGVKLLKAKDDFANYKYLYYALQSAEIPNTGYNRHFKWLKEVNIPLPDKDIQTQIVNVLDKVSDLIALRKQQLAKLDELVKARFIEMFGDVALNPNGYPVKDFDEICVLITDGEHATPRRTEEGIYLLSARNVLNHTLQLDDVDYIDEEEYNRIARRVIPQAGDVLISCSGSIGRCCVVPDGLKFQMVRSAALIRFDDTINPIFAEWLITSDDLQRQIAQSATQSSQANLFQGKIRKLHGYVPPLELQEQFAVFVEQTNKSKSEIQTALTALETLKKALMQHYFG